MGLVTWTAVFSLPDVRDSREEVESSLNGLIGAELQRRLRPRLAERGWTFAEAWPEDHGWHTDALAPDEPKRVVVSLVTCPELDEAGPGGAALEDRWRVVTGIDLGLLPQTKAHRTAVFKRLAKDVEDACHGLRAQAFTWELGGP